MGLKVTNNAYGTLNASITSSATTIVLVSGQGARFPTLSAGDYFYATLIDTSNNLEIVKVTARSTDTLTVVRAQDSTTARAYSTNDRFELRPTAALFNEKANANEYLPLAGGTMTGRLVIGAGADRSIDLLNNSGTAQGYIGVEGAFGGAPSNSLRLRGEGGVVLGAVGTAHLISDSSGYITTPNQPAFSAIGTGTQSWSGGSSANVLNITIKTGAIAAGRAAGFNTSTKRFTAPVAGVYAFFHGYTITSAATGPESYLYLNGSSIYRMGVIGYMYSGGYFTATSFEIMNLNANDYVDVRVQNNNNVSMTIDLGRSYFGGYLIG